MLSCLSLTGSRHVVFRFGIKTFIYENTGSCFRLTIGNVTIISNICGEMRRILDALCNVREDIGYFSLRVAETYFIVNAT